jgi:hypothetical protein
MRSSPGEDRLVKLAQDWDLAALEPTFRKCVIDFLSI